MATSKVKNLLIALITLTALVGALMCIGAKLALDEAKLPTKLKAHSWTYFFFTEEERAALQSHYDENPSTAVTLTVAVPALSESARSEFVSSPRAFYYGFLDANDFLNAGTARKAQYTRNNFITKKDIEAGTLKKVLAGTDIRTFTKLLPQKPSESERYTLVKVSFALSKSLSEYKTPKGFFIYTDAAVKVLSATFERATVGFDIGSAPLFFGVPSTGGPFGDTRAVDFTGGSEVFSLTNTTSRLMPKLSLAFQTIPNAKTQSLLLNIAGTLYKLFPSEGELDLTVQTSLFKSPFSRYEVKSDGTRLTKLQLSDNDLPAPNTDTAADSGEEGESSLLPTIPLPSDTGLIVQSTAEHWRSDDYELYSWDRFPTILIFDTRNYAVQRDFFRRLAFFAEKKGYKGRVLTDSQLGDKHGYNAHDYSAKSIANFFTVASAFRVKLNKKEYLLRDIALANGLIAKGANGAFVEGRGAVISISQESPQWLRSSLSNHELWHGLYFTDEDFRAQTALIFDSLAIRERNFIIGYFNSQETLGYDSSDELLMQNEFMAYIMQQSVAATPPYFLHLANRGSVISTMPKLCQYVRSDEGRMFLPPAKKFDEYAKRRWGLSCGRAGLMY